MRFLGIGDHHSLGDMYRRLAEAGHEIRVYVSQPESHDIYAGINQRVERWEDSVDWIREAGRDGVIIMETASFGALQDELRGKGLQVFGSSTAGERLENDRAFGQQVLREAGFQTAPLRRFKSVSAAIAYTRQRPRRYVFKVQGSEAASTRTYVGQLPSGDDLVAILGTERSRLIEGTDEFVLMDHLDGVEVGVGAYFDGRAFVGPVCLDWEHKRLFPGDLGEMTGEMGTVVTYRGGERLFGATLGRLRGVLQDMRYCGYINLNTIVNEDGVWPLEFTCRFGYPGFAICDALHRDDWSRLFRIVMGQSAGAFRTRSGFAVGVVLTVPPFPYEHGYAELSKGLPLFFDPACSPADHLHFHLGEVERREGVLRLTGSIGFVMTVTGTARSVAAARKDAYRRARRVTLPNVRYRLDIGEKLLRHDLAVLRRLGWVEPPPGFETRAGRRRIARSSGSPPPGA